MSDKDFSNEEVKVRRSWKINPKTQVVQSKKKYDRAKFKQEIKQNLGSVYNDDEEDN